MDELKQLLAEGKITQAEYDQKVAELQAQGSTEGSTNTPDFDISKILESDALKKLIQSETDKVRQKYATEKKELEKKVDEYRQANMTKEEVLAEKERNIAEFEAKVKRQALDFETVKILETQKLPTSLLTHISGGSIEERTENLSALVSIMDAYAQTKLTEKFGTQNHSFVEGKGSKTDVSKMSISEQIKYYTENPEAFAD